MAGVANAPVIRVAGLDLGGISGGEDVPEHSAVTGLIFAGGLLLAGVVGYGLLLTGGRRHGKKT